jgi:radical SAM protein with 4Fe4S-binding SPASM domain
MKLARLQTAARLFAPGVHMPVYLLVFATARCDAHCGHCFYWQELNSGKRELTLEEYERLARSLGPVLQITLTGGNPELRTDLAEIAAIFYRHCRPAHMTLCLLGRHTDRVLNHVATILQTCPNLALTVGLSLDGVGEEHDRIRELPGLFENVLATFAKLSELKRANPRLALDAAITVSGLNYASAEATAEWAWSHLPIDTLKPILVRGSPKDPGAVDNRCRAPYLRIIERDGARLGLNRRSEQSCLASVINAKEVVEREVIARTVADGVSSIVCSGARETAVIYPDGDVAGCEPRSELLGNLRDVDMDLRRLWFSPQARAFRRSAGRKAVCRGCYHHCFISPAIFRTPRLWPRLARALRYTSHT